MTFRLGLTGSIGMGKSTTAQMFRDLGIPVWDADATVHRLYSKGGAAVGPVSALFPQALVDGAISRDQLRSIIADDPNALTKIEQIVHPLVADDRRQFLESSSGDIIVLDIPLLFENGAERLFDAVLVVSAPPDVQMSRVLARAGMTLDRFQAILTRQMPDAEKRARADYVIETLTLDGTRKAVESLVHQIRQGMTNA